jgi:Asp-tRNA(Asn)/Glu-tRNA(Gln) amidotransferase A subunit family amidase
MSDPSRFSAVEALRRIRNGTLSPTELMEACLDRVAAREPEVQAFAYLDPAQAIRMAEMATPGQLHGLPFAAKDVLDTADMPTEYNSPIWRGWRPRADAAAVAWARAEGAVAIGKTVTTEFATRHPGPTANPHDLGRTPGGSSSGSAAAVADHMVPVAFGTQTAGSVIRPAAYCGIVGFKPTFGMISRIGMKLMSDSLDTVGVLAREVADCALFAGAVAGRDLGDPDVKPDRAPRIGICASPMWDKAQPETKTLLQGLADRVSMAGAHVQERELPALFAELEAAHPVVMNYESACALGWELTQHRDQVSEVLRERMDWGLSQPVHAVEQARATMERCRSAFPLAMEGLDILLTPAAPGEAPEGLGWTGDPAFNFIWTSLHVPCVTVPAATGPNGMPLGIQIIARRGEDQAALTWARWVAAAVG